MPGSLSYLSDELRNLNAMASRTLQEAFPNVNPSPGDLTLWLASPTGELSAQGVESLVKQPGRTGRIILPYSPAIDSVTVRDHALNQDVLVIGSQQLFQSICVAGRLDDPYVCSEERPDLVFKSGFE